MAQFTILLSSENTKYINAMTRITGMTPSALISRAVDMKRDFDKDFMDGFNSLLEKFDIPVTAPGKKAYTRKDVNPDEYADSIVAEIEDTESRANDDLMDDINNDDYLRIKLTEMKRQATR